MTFAIYPSLKGRTAFITGGASGIGADMVRAFAEQGSRVGFVDIDAGRGEALAAEFGPEVAFEACDLRDIDALKGAFERLKGRVGAANVLVNNAARDDRHGWETVTPEYYDERIQTNLRHMFFATQGIRVNTVVPGWIMTERQKELWVTPESLDAQLERQCIPVPIEPVYLARMVLFLASDDSAMCTANNFMVEGGALSARASKPPSTLA